MMWGRKNHGPVAGVGTTDRMPIWGDMVGFADTRLTSAAFTIAAALLFFLDKRNTYLAFALRCFTDKESRRGK